MLQIITSNTSICLLQYSVHLIVRRWKNNMTRGEATAPVRETTHYLYVDNEIIIQLNQYVSAAAEVALSRKYVHKTHSCIHTVTYQGHTIPPFPNPSTLCFRNARGKYPKWHAEVPLSTPMLVLCIPRNLFSVHKPSRTQVASQWFTTLTPIKIHPWIILFELIEIYPLKGKRDGIKLVNYEVKKTQGWIRVDSLGLGNVLFGLPWTLHSVTHHTLLVEHVSSCNTGLDSSRGAVAYSVACRANPTASWCCRVDLRRCLTAYCVTSLASRLYPNR